MALTSPTACPALTPSLRGATLAEWGEAAALGPPTPEAKPTRQPSQQPQSPSKQPLAAEQAGDARKAIVVVPLPPATALAVRAGPTEGSDRSHGGVDACSSAAGGSEADRCTSAEGSSPGGSSCSPLRMSESPSPLKASAEPLSATGTAEEDIPSAAVLERGGSGGAKARLSCRWEAAAWEGAAAYGASAELACPCAASGCEGPAKGPAAAAGVRGSCWVDQGEMRDGMPALLPACAHPGAAPRWAHSLWRPCKRGCLRCAKPLALPAPPRPAPRSPGRSCSRLRPAPGVTAPRAGQRRGGGDGRAAGGAQVRVGRAWRCPGAVPGTGACMDGPAGMQTGLLKAADLTDGC